MFPDIFVTVVSVYAPTFRAHRHIKEAFWSDLQGCLAAVPDCDKFLLSDFMLEWIITSMSSMMCGTVYLVVMD